MVWNYLILETVSYTHLRAHETSLHLVCRLLLEKKTNASPNKNHSEKNTWLALQKNIKTNNPVEIRQTLQDWAQTLSTDNKKQTINDLEDYLSNSEDKSKLSNSITELERCLYKEEKTFDSNDLFDQLQKLRKEIQSENSKQSKADTLAPLYNA